MASSKRKQRVPITWEIANPAEFPVLAYCVYVSSLPVWKTRKKASKREKGVSESQSLLQIEEAHKAEINPEGVETKERVDYPVRLPYTRQALINRKAAGRPLPKEIEELIYS